MAKYDTTTLSNLSSNPTSAQTNINTERTTVQTAIENTLSRDGTSPNTMEAALDMNSNAINNVSTLTVGGKVVSAWEWQGAWVTSTAYVINDIASNNGSSYICILAHTSGDTDDEPGVGTVESTYWDDVALKGTAGATGATGATGASGSGTGDMVVATYDPTAVSGDIFDTDNHVDGSTNHVFTAADDTKLAGIATSANLYVHPNHSGDVTSTADGATVIGAGKVTAAMRATAAVSTAAQFRAKTASVGLDGDIVYAAAAEVTLTDAVTIALDMDTFINAVVTLTDNRTLGNPTNLDVGQSGYIRIVQDAGGTNTLAYGTSWEFAGGTAPTLTVTGSAEDVLHYVVMGPTRVLGSMTLNVS